MRRQLFPSIISMILFTLLLGVGFPLVVLGIGQVAFHDQANGSLVGAGGKDVGSSLIGQSFTDRRGNPVPKYFQSRPSAAAGADGSSDVGYDPTLSSGSNLGPTNPDLIQEVARRIKDYRELNGLDATAEVPVDAVTASASGLDPEISIANARLQAQRVADARGLTLQQVLTAIDDHTSGRTLGTLGEKTVNVLELNLALDRRAS